MECGFQLRKELLGEQPEFESVKSDAMVVESDEDKFDNSKVLAESGEFVVRKLAPEMWFLGKDRASNGGVRGLVNCEARKAMVNDSDYLYIWDYESGQKEVSYSKIMLHDERSVMSESPLCLFTWPAAVDGSVGSVRPASSGSELGDSGLCNGLVVIMRKAGKLLFYEDYQSINNLYSQLSKIKAHELDLKLKSNETIDLAINCEPSGIAIATSLGRVLFVTIRSHDGKIDFSSRQQLNKPQANLLFFNAFRQPRDVVSLRSGPILGRGNRLLYITTRSGNFQIWQLSVLTNSFKRVDLNLYESILGSLQELYPFAHGTLQILGSHPLSNDSTTSHIVLSSITDNEKYYYILSSITIEEQTNSFSIFSTYRINTYFEPLHSNGNKPQLLAPDSLENTDLESRPICVVFPNAAVLTKVSCKYNPTQPLRRKWEDVISFNQNLTIVGNGCDEKSIFLISKEIGVIKITINENSDKDMEAVRFVKTHIDQAIYFSRHDWLANPIEVKLPSDLTIPTEEIEQDIIAASEEVFKSLGKYIPQIMNSSEQLLKLKLRFYSNLIDFVTRNFNDKISSELKTTLIENYEMINCCFELESFVKNSNEISKIWESILQKIEHDTNMDTLVISKLDVFPELFKNFLQDLSRNALSSNQLDFKSEVVDLLSQCVYTGVLEQGEHLIRHEKFNMNLSSPGTKLLWCADITTLESINRIFFDYKFSLKVVTQNNKEQLLKMVKLLYYLTNQAKLWATTDYSTTEERKLIMNIFKNNHKNWNQVLCEIGMSDESLQISEFYRDLESLVETLESLNFEDSKRIYEQLFEQLGYEFTEVLFDHYFAQQNYSALFFRFPEQNEQLINFLSSSPKYYSVAWIQDIFNNDYTKASQTLLAASKQQDVSAISNIANKELQLNIAKLAALVEPELVSKERLNNIDMNLEIVACEKSLAKQLETHDLKMCPKYSTLETETLFLLLKSYIKEGTAINLDQILEFLTLSDSQGDNFTQALTLLANASHSLNHETKTYWTNTIWRRVILIDMENYDNASDLTLSVLSNVTKSYFQNELYLSGLPLPHYTSILNMRDMSVDMKLLQKLYSSYSIDLEAMKQAITHEFNLFESLSSILEKNVTSIIASANESSGYKCTINYETNTIESEKLE